MFLIKIIQSLKKRKLVYRSYKEIYISYNILVPKEFSFLNISNIFQVYFSSKAAVLYTSRRYLISG